jgi:catechol 1,2-dioxygenase
VKIDVWQANDEGFYDVQQKGIQPDFNCPSSGFSGMQRRFRSGGSGSVSV